MPTVTRTLAEHRRRYRRQVLLGRIILLCILLLFWQFAEVLGLATRTALPAPAEVAVELGEVVVSGAVLSPLWATLLSWSLGLAISLVVGNVLGVLIASSEWIVQSTRFVVDFFRSVPSVAFVPLVILLFGSSLQMKLSLIVLGATWDVLIQALYAARQKDSVAMATLSVYHVAPANRAIWLELPSALPFMITGLRLAAVQALMLTIGAEIIGGAPGLGRELAIAQEVGRMPVMYSYIIIVALLGITINMFVTLLRNRVMHWHVDVRGEKR